MPGSVKAEGREGGGVWVRGVVPWHASRTATWCRPRAAEARRRALDSAPPDPLPVADGRIGGIPPGDCGAVEA